MDSPRSYRVPDGFEAAPALRPVWVLNGAGCWRFVVFIPFFDEVRVIGGVVVRALRCMGGFECAVRLGRLSFVGD